MTTRLHAGAIATAIFAPLLIIGNFIIGEPESTAPQPVTQIVAMAPAVEQISKEEWVPAGTHIWTGVKLYYGIGENKMLVGEVMGGNRHYTSPITGEIFSGLKIRMKSGSVEWKSRDVVADLDGYWFVRADDPAVERWDWREYKF